MSVKKIIIKRKTVSSSETPSNYISGLVSSLNADPDKFIQASSNIELARVLEILSDHYYNKTALVEDIIFDQIQDAVRERDPTNQSLQKIGAPIQIINEHHRIKVKLPYWMGSMDKVKPDSSNLRNWFQTYVGPYLLTDKLDGVSALLIIDLEKSLCKLYSRGDGEYGQDISFLLQDLGLEYAQLKDKLSGSNKQIAIRGELIMSKEKFKQYASNSSNARNLVAGIVNSKHLDRNSIQDTDFIAYELLSPDGLTPSEQFEELMKIGFQVANPIKKNELSDKWLTEYLTERRKHSKYEIDGIIITEDKHHNRNISGNPKYAVAFKTVSTIKSTVVIGVQWNVQKDGYLFPVINVEQVVIDRVKVSNCSGKNAKYILDNKIGPGSKLLITRDGDVIPGVYRVVSPSASGTASLPDMNEMKYHWTETETDIVLDCLSDNCEVVFKQILNFFKVLGVTGFGKGNISLCIEHKLDSILKIINAEVADFLKLPGIQIKTASKIYDNIRKSLSGVSVVTMMVASNTLGRGLGTRKLNLLFKHIPDAASWEIASIEQKNKYLYDICKVPGFEKKTANLYLDNINKYHLFVKSLPEWVQKEITNPYRRKIIIKKIGAAAVGQQSKIEPKKTRFNNLTIVFSGGRNKDWEKVIEREGGKVTNSVSRNTTMVVSKSKDFTSSKITKAQDYKIPIYTLDEFKDKFNL